MILSFGYFGSIAFSKIVVCILSSTLLCSQKLDGLCKIFSLIAHELIQLHLLVEQVKCVNQTISSFTDLQQGLLELEA